MSEVVALTEEVASDVGVVEVMVIMDLVMDQVDVVLVFGNLNSGIAVELLTSLSFGLRVNNLFQNK